MECDPSDERGRRDQQYRAEERMNDVTQGLRILKEFGAAKLPVGMPELLHGPMALAVASPSTIVKITNDIYTQAPGSMKIEVCHQCFCFQY